MVEWPVINVSTWETENEAPDVCLMWQIPVPIF